jgi:hypothetical protein
MSRGNKLVIGSLAAVAILAGSFGGYVAMADTEEDVPEANQESIAPPETQLLDRVAEILSIEEEELKSAVAQARQEMMDEAFERRLDRLVEEEVITEEEAQDYLEWWQERPDVPMDFGLRGGFHEGGRCTMLPGGRMFRQGPPSD